ncbi:MobA/MobL family protein [Acidovorax sp. JG5]|uniref:MobA/MobL family protein n=1 Tax=Acidovorax sp. JG5 TaxID=2822718 RepID=UPI001B335C5D|nr:MobA/MobL family protein [Acidovorax sp. JG5]MBP3981289.1 MobA/MobL family protein [Acidovorax sp. JG5]
MANLATWFSPSLQTISRSSGRSSVIAAAYRACTKLTDERIGITRDFTPKGKNGLAGNICIGILDDDISKLWNDAENAETRVNSTVARELMVPLASEWSDHERRECVRAIAQMLRDEYGVAVLASIHRPARDNKNDHAHILFTTRTVDADGVFGEKTRILDSAKTGEVKKMRERVCAIVNEHALANGSDWYVYAGKFANVLEDHIPTDHISIKHGKNQQALIDANREDVGQARIELGRVQKDFKSNTAKIAELTTHTAIAESSSSANQTADNSKVVPLEVPVYKIDLKRIPMPVAAIEARAQIEKAIGSRNLLRQHFEAWKDMRDQLLAKPPTPKYGFFGGPTASYKKAWAEHVKGVQGAKDSMAECTKKADGLVAYIQDPERQRLHTIYHDTNSHNAKVEVHEKQMAHEKECEWERIAQAQRERERLQESQTDWSARLQESNREMEARRERESATEYSSGGMGM